MLSSLFRLSSKSPISLISTSASFRIPSFAKCSSLSISSSLLDGFFSYYLLLYYLISICPSILYLYFIFYILYFIFYILYFIFYILYFIFYILYFIFYILYFIFYILYFIFYIKYKI